MLRRQRSTIATEAHLYSETAEPTAAPPPPEQCGCSPCPCLSFSLALRTRDDRGHVVVTTRFANVSTRSIHFEPLTDIATTICSALIQGSGGRRDFEELCVLEMLNIVSSRAAGKSDESTTHVIDFSDLPFDNFKDVTCSNGGEDCFERFVAIVNRSRPAWSPTHDSEAAWPIRAPVLPGPTRRPR